MVSAAVPVKVRPVYKAKESVGIGIGRGGGGKGGGGLGEKKIAKGCDTTTSNSYANTGGGSGDNKVASNTRANPDGDFFK